MGEFNFDMLQRQTCPSVWRDLLNQSGLTILNKEPTRITTTSSTMIDLLVTSKADRYISYGLWPCPFSDHHFIYGVQRAKVQRQAKTIAFRKYSLCDRDKFADALEGVPWHVLENRDTVDDMLYIW